MISSIAHFVHLHKPMIGTVSAESIWTQTSDSDFNLGTLDNLSLIGSGSSAKLSLNINEGGFNQSFGSNGVVLSNPSGRTDFPYSIAMDSDYIYTAGYAEVIQDDEQWHIEKRDKYTGALVTSFDGDGIVMINPTSGWDYAYSIDVDSEYIYIAGMQGTISDHQWRIEKRNKTTGALVTSFDIDGIVLSNPTSEYDVATNIKIDANYIYVAGIPSSRIEKRDIITGALVPSFDSDGILTSNGSIGSIALDSEFLYIAGGDNSSNPNIYQWRIEKRNKTTGILEPAFDGDGIVVDNPSTSDDFASSISLDKFCIYVAGYDSSIGDLQWRIEKRNIITGALETTFDNDGIVLSNPDSYSDMVESITIDSENIYIAGNSLNVNNDHQWYVEKRNKITGELNKDFDDDGIVIINPSTAMAVESAYSIVVDNSENIYIAGSDFSIGFNDFQWRIEKRGSAYHDLGNYFSPIFDSKENGTIWNEINWTEHLFLGTDITITTRTGNTIVPDTSWSDWSSEYTNPDGSVITSPRSRYIQYCANLSTSDTTISPELDEVTIIFDINTGTPPILTAPENNTWINNSKPTFYWTYNDNEGDSQSYFIVEFDDDSDFRSVDHTSNRISSPFEYWTPDTDIPDGIWNWQVRTEDNYGKISDNSSTMVLKLDQTPPLKFTPIANPSYWTNNSQPIISFSTTDTTSGIEHYEISIDNSSFIEIASPIFLPELMEGIHNTTIRAYDNANNYVDAYVNVFIDLTLPYNLTIIAGPEQLTNNSQPIITFSANDSLSGIDHYEIKIDDGDYSLQTSPMTLPEQSDGIHSITLRAYDKAGNYQDESIEIFVDTTPPESLSILINDGATQTNTTNVTLTLDAIDSLSGLYQMAFSTDGSKWSNWENYSEKKLYSLSDGDGSKTIYFKVIDLAGNEANPIYATIILNTTIVTNKTDTDADGYPDEVDAFPSDPTEWFDTDDDGYGDNSDAFINNSNEWLDTDEDGMGNNADPDDDNDGVSDIDEDIIGTNPLLEDTDGDGYNDEVDDYPLDSTKWEKEESGSDDDEENTMLYTSIGIIIITILVLILWFIFLKKKKEKEEDAPIQEILPEHVRGFEAPHLRQQPPTPEFTPQVPQPQVEPAPPQPAPMPQVEEQPVPQPQVKPQPQGQATVPRVKEPMDEI
jgi:hypothetical protein